MERIILSIVVGFLAHFSSGQNVSYSPEVLVGDRSVVYQHIQRMDLKPKWIYQNTFLIDNEYNSNTNRMYFFRNSLNFRFSDKWQSMVAFGFKNPGLFSTISSSYRNISRSSSFSYSIGMTFQKGLSLEQSLFFRKNVLRIAKFTCYYQIFVLANINKTGYSRGFQQVRIGLEKNRFEFGLGLKFDQFNNSAKTLVNQGIYFKIKIKKSYNYEN